MGKTFQENITFKNQKEKMQFTSLTVDEIEKAERISIKRSQYESFKDHIKNLKSNQIPVNWDNFHYHLPKMDF